MALDVLMLISAGSEYCSVRPRRDGRGFVKQTFARPPWVGVKHA